MHIYIDFDDCLSETGRYFSELVKELIDKEVPYEDILHFDLQQSFRLNDEQYDRLMFAGHTPEALMSFEEAPGASETINRWIDCGHDVSIITGRPVSVYEPSRRWLDEHGLSRVKLFCLNKYGRDTFLKGSEFNLELEDYYKMRFDYAIEDSPIAFQFFEHMPDLKVLVFDRPWNQQCEFPNHNYRRCRSWEEIAKVFEA